MLSLIAGAADVIAVDKDFVPVDTSALPTVSGNALLVAAYAVILCAFLGYGLHLLWRERKLGRAASELKERLERARKSG